MSPTVGNVLAVALGGALGAVLRFFVSTRVNAWTSAMAFPTGTLAVNAIGCFIIGWTTGTQVGRAPWSDAIGLFLIVGLLGGFTTFSAFGNETIALVREGAALKATLNVALQLGVCLVAVALGLAAGTGR